METASASIYGMDVTRRAVFIAGAALLTACTSQAPFSPAVAPAGTAGLAQRGLLTDRAAKSSELLYVSNLDLPGVLVFEYPSGKFAGGIWGRGEVQGLCTDAAGNVFMASVALGEIFEYAHGGTLPIATLKDPGQAPWGCAVDPKTGDLAVANFESDSGGPGSISIYKGAKGKPTIYPDTKEFLYVYYAAYGADGAIYLDGLTNGNGFGFAAFRSGKFTPVTLDVSIQNARAIAGVGSNVDVVDDDTPGSPVIYQFKISGSTGTKVGETKLTGPYVAANFDVIGKTVVVTNSEGYSGQNGNVMYFKYPAGGSPTKTFTYHPYFAPQAVTLSEVK